MDKCDIMKIGPSHIFYLIAAIMKGKKDKMSTF